MNDHPPHAGDIVRVHPGITIRGRNLGGMHVTVIRPQVDELVVSEWAGDRFLVPAADVDVVTRKGVAP